MDAIRQLETTYRKPALPQIQSGDTVRVHQLIREGNKQRIQIFEGVVIRRHRLNEVTATITVRRVASGVGVEKTFLLHSPNVSKLEVIRRAKVRRNFLSYLRNRRGKSARLRELAFDKIAANDVSAPVADTDTEVTELDVDKIEDALDNAEPLSAVENAENRAAADQDETTSAQDDEHVSEQQLEVDEVEAGLAKAQDGEGKAVAS
jgi:large subunit ribosomal protein L19